jgi:penicillin-binding protein 1A
MAAGPSLDDRDPRAPKRRRTTKRVARAARASMRPPWMRIARIVVALGVLGALAAGGALIGLFVYYGSDPKLPNLSRLDAYRPKQVTRILDRNGVAIGELGSEKRTVVPFDAIPKVLVHAVVAAEDADYFQHSGLDYRGMLRAFIENVLRGRTAQGGSTITQQVVKTMLLSPERTMRRKVQEIILARQLSQKLSKEDVLALYLNQIYYGHGRYGCEEAARYFFGKSVREIGLAEAAVLAGLPQSPERLSPRKHPDAAKTRQRYVLGQMAERGYIDRKVADKLAAEPIRLAREPSSARGTAAEAVDATARFLVDKVGERAAFESGTTVATTIDARLQELARAAVEHGLEEVDARQGYRGPSGHLTGKPLEKKRHELAKAFPKLRDSDIFDGLVLRVEGGAEPPKVEPPATARGDKAKADKAKAAVAKAPEPAKTTGAAKPARLFVDIGGGEGKEGVVDFSLEPRYAKGTKPIGDRFKAGDLVRVRLATERPRAEDGPIPLALELGPQAAMVVLEPASREILALVGGYDYHAGGFDRAERAHRQPGSAFKPIYYAAAVESRRITPATIINDSPDVYGDWKPDNYEKEEYRGPVRIRTALAHSINTVSIKVLSDLGVDPARAFAARIGITSEIKPDVGLALALGALSVTPKELANAYATFASGGQGGQPVLIRALGDEKIPAPPLTPVLSPEVAYVMTSLMRSVIDEGTAHAAVASKPRRPAAGKTGTSNRKRDTVDA